MNIHSTSITAIGGTVSFWKWQHDDIIKWKDFPHYWPFVWGIHRSPVNSPHKASDGKLWCSIWSVPWINSWVNNSETGDLRHHHTHYDVTVMIMLKHSPVQLQTVIHNMNSYISFMYFTYKKFHPSNQMTGESSLLMSEFFNHLRWPDNWIVRTLYLPIFLCVLPLALGPVSVDKIPW